MRVHAIFDVPPDRIRPDVASFLKRILRTYGFKCIRIKVMAPKPIMLKPGEAVRMMA